MTIGLTLIVPWDYHNCHPAAAFKDYTSMEAWPNMSVWKKSFYYPYPLGLT
jgi:hypothetical protein